MVAISAAAECYDRSLYKPVGDHFTQRLAVTDIVTIVRRRGQTNDRGWFKARDSLVECLGFGRVQMVLVGENNEVLLFLQECLEVAGRRRTGRNAIAEVRDPDRLSSEYPIAAGHER